MGKLIGEPRHAPIGASAITEWRRLLGETLHQNFLLALTVLFVAVFAVMVVAEVRHRRACRAHASAGWLQWFWLTLPFVILLAVDFALMRLPAP